MPRRWLMPRVLITLLPVIQLKVEAAHRRRRLLRLMRLVAHRAVRLLARCQESRLEVLHLHHLRLRLRRTPARRTASISLAEPLRPTATTVEAHLITAGDG